MMIKLELFVLYFLIPGLFAFDFFSFKDRWIYFLIICIYIIYQSYKNKLFKQLKFICFGKKEIIRALILTLISLIALRYYVQNYLVIDEIDEQETFYLFISFFYPMISVPLQEFFFRFYYFERYNIQSNSSFNYILLNILSFAIYHYMYGGFLAVILTGIAGIVFSMEYFKNRNFLTVWLYHALMGIVVFISGLANFFTDLFMK